MRSETLPQVVRRKEAILFDLFHTLTALESTWSSGPMTFEALGVSKRAWDEQLLEKSRERLSGEIKDPVTIIRKMAHAIDPSISEKTIAAAVKNRKERFAGALLAVPDDTCKVLVALKAIGKKIGLISNADVMEVAAWDRSPIAPYFDSVVFSCQVGYVKPEAEIYRLSMQQLGVEARRCLFVGDGGSHELEGARNLGITTVMIAGIIREIWPDRIKARQAHADYVIEWLSELIRDGDRASVHNGRHGKQPAT